MRTLPLWLIAIAAALGSTFQGPIPIGLSNQGLTPIRLASADINRDGVGDLISVNAGAQAGTATLSIATGSRIGIATSVVEQAISGNVIDMAAADFTNDGVPDILLLMQVSTFSATRMNLCLYAGNGIGGLLSPNCTVVNDTATRLGVGDFNADGRLDAALPLPPISQIALWINRGDQFFTAGATTIVATPGPIAVADLNGDRIADIIVHNRAGELRVLASAQGAPFRAEQILPVSAGITDISLADVNRDGQLDIAAADPSTNSYLISLGAGPTPPFFRTAVSVSTAAAPTFVLFADFNGDRQPELIASTTAGLTVAQFSATGDFLQPPLPGFGIAGSIRMIVLDFNGDGQLDMASASGPNVTLFIGQSAPTLLTFEATPTTGLFGQRTTIKARLLANTLIPPIFPIGVPRVRLMRGDQMVQEIAAVPTGTGPQPPGPRELATVNLEATLPVGEHDLTLVFPGTPGYAPTTSTTIRVTVQPAPSLVRFSVAGNEISRATGLRVNGLASSAFGPAIGGNVQLLLNGSIVSQGIVNNGVAQLFIPPGLPLGRVRAKLQFQGEGYVASESPEMDLVVRGPLAIVSAPVFRAPIAPGSLAVVTAEGFVHPSTRAESVPWPLILGRVSAEIRGEPGAPSIGAGVVFAGDGQVNIYVPPQVMPGQRTIRLLLDGFDVASGEVTVARTAPGLFMIDGRVDGVPAALAATYSPDGAISPVPVFRCEFGACAAVPLEIPGNGDPLVLSLFATGVRGATRVTVTISGVLAEVLYAGAHPTTPGLDQINVIVSAAVVGRGLTELIVTADGMQSNRAQIAIR